MEVQLRLRTLRRLLVGIVCFLAAAGLAAEFYDDVIDGPDPWDLEEFFSLSYEANVPTWAASLLHFSTALALALRSAVARRAGQRWVAHWTFLSFAFLYVSLDESVRIHESLYRLLDLGGVLYFSWIVPASAVVLLLALAYAPFLLALPARTRNRFVLAAVVFVGGALGMELPLGWWTDRHGDSGFVYATIDWVEETMELTGVSLMLYAVVRDLAWPGDALRAALPAAAAGEG